MKTTIVTIILFCVPLCLAQQMVVEDLDANILMEVNDEGTVGSITLPQGTTPATTSDKLYNVGGVLQWNGSALIPSQTGQDGKVLTTNGTNTAWKIHNVPMANFEGGNQRFQITANYGSYNNVRTVTLTVPGPGKVIAHASGYVDWESKGWDLLLASILRNADPNTSWQAENEWYSYLTIVTDYNCADSSDQYTSFNSHRGFNVNAGTHTFTLWANKYSSASKTEVGDVNLSVTYFPTGSTILNSMLPAEAEDPQIYMDNSVANPPRRAR